MRLDLQHQEYHPHILGLPVYFGTSKEGSAYWQDMCHAFALVMRDHDAELLRVRIGAATGVVLLTRLAIKWLPEPYAAELQAKYLILRQKRQACDEIDAANTPAT